jgi:hypothetical protein
MKKFYLYKINSSKLNEKERLQRQINLTCKRIKDKTGYTGIFKVLKGYNNDDFVEDKITVRIATDKL